VHVQVGRRRRWVRNFLLSMVGFLELQDGLRIRRGIPLLNLDGSLRLLNKLNI
jgi:hypothetical protein